MENNMKRPHFTTLVFSSVLVFCSSCAGTHLPIPGEKAVIESNIENEYLNIAKAYENLKNYTKALEYYNLAVKADKSGNIGNSVDYSMGRCYALSGDWKNALSKYNSLLEKDPGNVSLKSSVAYILAMKGDFEEACSRYEALVSENPQDASLLKNYISVLIAAEKNERAEEMILLLKESFPDDKDIETIEKKLKKPEAEEKEAAPAEEENKK